MKRYHVAVPICLAILLTMNSGWLRPLAVHRDEPRKMMYGDRSRLGRPYAKDPHVVKFKGRYLMYFSVPAYTDSAGVKHGWGIGVAESRNLVDWQKIAEIPPVADYEKAGICAPGALLKDGKIHLFYQTYGGGPKDAICHAWSDDGIHFTRNTTNPIFRPTGDWNCGRAIDAEVYRFKNNYFLYFATRDPAYKNQILGVAVTPLKTTFNRDEWKQLSTDGPILKPELPWEGECIEGASVIERNGELVMFYAGAYNNWPQQIGVAHSKDGLHWERMQSEPFLKNGTPGSWNASESGHPHVFDDTNKQTYLFYQGNNDKGHTWLLSNEKLTWKGAKPMLP
ncbi:family 43 glycosylhydrolase [Spirosoma sp. RP8]|uniref:Family 43 glycosylhydrolase n=1 Tax=Spirosoma liriopis TaxID=2937440 RepID=A0ABT0HSR0_9BACT|nr:family 43 glycosylhydrolase [Spirosoma liriopis]MCK8495010.1 family 43 glycosylhydrolase [Spirosoma liriopis]